MAQLTSEFTFTGPIGEISAYKMRGVSRIVIRKKGGPSKEKIKTSRAFQRTRQINNEFGGRSTATRWMMQMLWHIKALADYNIAGPLNALLKPIQVLDVDSKFGMRSVLLSKNPTLLEGFSLNKQNPFDTVMRTSPAYMLSKETLSAQVNIPELIPGINFFPSKFNPLYSIVAVLGVVPDLTYHDGLGYKPTNGYSLSMFNIAKTEWTTTGNSTPATILNLALASAMPDEGFCLMLSIGIRYGMPENATTVKQVERAGCGKVLGVR